jgi:hypothetical protein
VCVCVCVCVDNGMDLPVFVQWTQVCALISIRCYSDVMALLP